ncbi:MAG TPA: hypothetical protein VLT58_16385 [Polyangia bacterium]|nr:hypothetical protein [Polyangia bacterium]
MNSLIVVLAVLDALQAIPQIPPAWAPAILGVAGVLNVILRLTTSSGIAGFAPPVGVPLGEQPAYRAAHDASGDPAPAMRAAPAAQDAPPEQAGAPSAGGLQTDIARRIARDHGIDPDAVTPEDSV